MGDQQSVYQSEKTGFLESLGFFLFVLPLLGRWWCAWQVTKPAVYPVAGQCHADRYGTGLPVSCAGTWLQSSAETAGAFQTKSSKHHVFFQVTLQRQNVFKTGICSSSSSW